MIKRIQQFVLPKLYNSWLTVQSSPLEDGFTLLLTVPPDLPVFTKIALDVCRRQVLDDLVETLVIPDRRFPPFQEVFREYVGDWSHGPIRLIEPRWRDQWVRSWNRTASVIHWMQLINGVAACRSTHALLHDVDLFLLEPAFFRRHFQTCRDGQLACLGLDRPWSGAEWFDQPRFQHLVACWEMMFDVAWMRGFPPNEIRPHRASFPEGTWWFETTLAAQGRTPAARVARHEQPVRHVHFQHVIGTYRLFQAGERPFADERFCLLLIRLLIDQFDADGGPYALPALDEFAAGLEGRSRTITYAVPRAAAEYPSFRAKLEELLVSGELGAERSNAIRAALEPFDARFLERAAPSAP